MSLSRVTLKLFVDGQEVVMEVARHLAPKCVNALLRKVPFGTTGYRFGDLFVVRIGVGRGEEKPPRELDRGEVGYWAAADALCVALSKGGRKLVPVGRVVSGLNVLDEIRSASVKFEAAQSAGT